MQILEYCRRVHQTAVSKGWWDKGDRPTGELYALILSELGEAVEEIRLGRPAVYFVDKNFGTSRSDISPHEYSTRGKQYVEQHKPEGSVVELADAFIRICDVLGRYIDTKSSEAAKEEIDSLWMQTEIPEFEYDVCDSLIESIGLLPYGRFNLHIPSLAVFAKHIEYIAGDELFHLGAGCSFRDVVEAKMAYNETRPYRHGGRKH